MVQLIELLLLLIHSLTFSIKLNLFYLNIHSQYMLPIQVLFNLRLMKTIIFLYLFLLRLLLYLCLNIFDLLSINLFNLHSLNIEMELWHMFYKLDRMPYISLINLFIHLSYNNHLNIEYILFISDIIYIKMGMISIPDLINNIHLRIVNICLDSYKNIECNQSLYCKLNMFYLLNNNLSDKQYNFYPNYNQ